ncbi:MAG: diguanylate cyclase, partial [Porticoccus sp.]|nr:diguanylate cyclase [Porticoccus sp.]
SQLLRDQMRWADLVGRLDSGQFVFVLPETDKEAAISLANKIASQLNALKVTVDDQLSVEPQACFGVASWEKGDDIRLLLERSNEATQTAIQNGGFSVEAA